MISNNFRMRKLIINPFNRPMGRGLFPIIGLLLLVLTGCTTTLNPSDSLSPDSRSDSSSESGPNSGIYWFGKEDANQLAVPNESNPYYDPTHPTIIFVHGWKPDQGYTHRTMLWQFEDAGFRGYGDARPGGVLDRRRLECWRLRLGGFRR